MPSFIMLRRAVSSPDARVKRRSAMSKQTLQTKTPPNILASDGEVSLAQFRHGRPMYFFYPVFVGERQRI